MDWIEDKNKTLLHTTLHSSFGQLDLEDLGRLFLLLFTCDILLDLNYCGISLASPLGRSLMDFGNAKHTSNILDQQLLSVLKMIIDDYIISSPTTQSLYMIKDNNELNTVYASAVLSIMNPSEYSMHQMSKDLRAARRLISASL